MHLQFKRITKLWENFRISVRTSLGIKLTHEIAILHHWVTKWPRFLTSQTAAYSYTIASNKMFWLVLGRTFNALSKNTWINGSLFIISGWNLLSKCLKRCFMFNISIKGWLPWSPLSYGIGHNIVLNMENLCPKRKVRTHVFSALMASASCSETHGRVCGWLCF